MTIQSERSATGFTLPQGHCVSDGPADQGRADKASVCAVQLVTPLPMGVGSPSRHCGANGIFKGNVLV